MKRRLFMILFALSLLLFVAVCVLWVRSHMLSDRIRDRTFVGSSSLVTEVQSGLGVLGVELYMNSYPPTIADETRARFEANPLSLQMRHRKPWPQRPNFGRMNGGGYEWGPVEFASFRSASVASVGVRVVLPYWAWACVALLPSIPWLWHRWRRTQRLRSNACPSCGYDLRATPERCPECGRVPAAPPPSPLP